jgi:hypothetical protein
MMDNIPTPEERKKFAQEQVQFLKEQGVTNKLRLSRIFKAAGPGQIQEAWKLAEQASNQARKDLLDCILTGVQGSQDFGWDRMVAVLTEAGFTPPEAASSRSFFRILDGAIEILVPNSYDFSENEIKEIEKGLNKKLDREPGELETV